MEVLPPPFPDIPLYLTKKYRNTDFASLYDKTFKPTSVLPLLYRNTVNYNNFSRK